MVDLGRRGRSQKCAEQHYDGAELNEPVVRTHPEGHLLALLSVLAVQSHPRTALTGSGSQKSRRSREAPQDLALRTPTYNPPRGPWWLSRGFEYTPRRLI